MWIQLKPSLTSTEKRRFITRLRRRGFRLLPHPRYSERFLVLSSGSGEQDFIYFQSLPEIERVERITTPYKQVSLAWREDPTRITLGNGLTIGGSELVLIAGPCSVESYDQLLQTARMVKAAGAHILRGGTFKPRTSPYAFQGLGLEGVKILYQVGKETGMPVITEVLAPSMVARVVPYVDLLQVGSRNMQNFPLLKALGRCGKPVLLKRGLAATLTETLLAAEYIVNAGNEQVILCERGIRTPADHTRFTLDVSAVTEWRQRTHLPVMVDPSHAAGKASAVIPLALAGLAAGAQGLIVEVHPQPAKALSDSEQQLNFSQFAQLVERVELLAQALGTALAPVPHPSHVT